MKRQLALMTPGHMVQATHMAKLRVAHWVKLADDVSKDVRKAERLAKQECKACFYSDRLGGAAMTQRDCMCCAKPNWNSSTNTDVLCLPCAQEHGLCRHCGGDLNMKERRKGWPTPKFEAETGCVNTLLYEGKRVHARDGRPLLDEHNEVIPASICLCAAHCSAECCCGAWDDVQDES